MSTTRHDYAVRMRNGNTVEMSSGDDARTIARAIPGASVYVRDVTRTEWRPDTEPPFPGARTMFDPQPDRYMPGSQYPGRSAIAGYCGIHPETRRIVEAVLRELAFDVRDLADPDTIRDVITERAESIGAPHP